MDELHAIDHIYIHNFAVFSVRLNSQRYEILEAQDCTDPTASLDLQWKVSLFLHSTYHYWSLKMQAIHIGSYPGQRAVYLIPVINIGPWEMCILSTLIFEILQSSTESCPSLCMIIRYGGGPWPPTKLIGAQYVIVPRLGGFHTLCEFPWGSRSHHGRLESVVITCTHLCRKHSDSHLWRQCFLLGGERPSNGRWS